MKKTCLWLASSLVLSRIVSLVKNWLCLEIKMNVLRMKKSNIHKCKYCNGDFIYIGNAPYIFYCSDSCAKLAQYEKIKNHKSKRLGTSELSSRRNKDFKREFEIVRNEKRKLRLA